MVSLRAELSERLTRQKCRNVLFCQLAALFDDVTNEDGNGLDQESMLAGYKRDNKKLLQKSGLITNN